MFARLSAAIPRIIGAQASALAASVWLRDRVSSASRIHKSGRAHNESGPPFILPNEATAAAQHMCATSAYGTSNNGPSPRLSLPRGTAEPSKRNYPMAQRSYRYARRTHPGLLTAPSLLATRSAHPVASVGSVLLMDGAFGRVYPEASKGLGTTAPRMIRHRALGDRPGGPVATERRPVSCHLLAGAIMPAPRRSRI